MLPHPTYVEWDGACEQSLERRHQKPDSGPMTVLPVKFSQGQPFRPELFWPRERLVSFGNHQAGNGWLEGGRSSLLESAQGATVSSVATLGFQRQCNGLPRVR